MSNDPNVMRDAMLGRMNAANARPMRNIDRTFWPADMEDVFHRVAFIDSNADEDEEWVCRSDALSWSDVHAMTAFMRTLRLRALEKEAGR